MAPNETTPKNEFGMLVDNIDYVMAHIQDIQNQDLRDRVALTCGLAMGFAARARSAEQKALA
jgi:hypothetical protein